MIESLVNKINSLKYLKIVYSLFYVLICIFFSVLHYLKHSSSYTQIVDVKNLNVSSLRTITDLRGLRHEKNYQYELVSTASSNEKVLENNTREKLEEIIKYTGIVYESELINSDVTNKPTLPKLFNSAGEFLESVEDSRESVWLIHIVMNNDSNTSSSCDKKASKYVSIKTWKSLNNNLSKFGILTGTFNCEREKYFCKLKGWHKPQLVLGLVKYDLFRSPKEFVKFYTYNNCKKNDFSSVLKWVNNKLTDAEQLKTSISNLKVYYLQNSSVAKLPFYYSAISFKYNRRANFYVISDLNQIQLQSCQKYANRSQTPIYLVINETFCYNYGTNLNELPNYFNFNYFLSFLYPDMNSIFMISFFFLNSFLLLIFFEYNSSLLRQLIRGFSYIFLFNLILFSIWLLTINTSSKELLKLTEFVGYYLDRLLNWFRCLIMYNDTTHFLASSLRFFVFYYAYLNPWLLLVNYIFVCLLFYANTRYNFKQINNNSLLRLQKISQKSDTLLNRSLSSRSNEQSQNQQHIQSENFDMDISVTELINQINGLTSIWLQSSTLADRLISELPSIEYCKCFRIKSEYSDYDATNSCEDESSGCDEATDLIKIKEYLTSNFYCKCGKNCELRSFLINENECLINFWKKFNSECSICLEKYAHGSFITLLPCGHLFHRKCIYEWFMNSVSYKCPVCRTSFYAFKKKFI